MINGEGWLEDKLKSNLYIVELLNYNRNIEYDLPIIPSPNLPNKRSINLYPSLCLFEGTNVSVGRGTNLQFQVYGSPYLDEKINNFSFIPKKNNGSQFPKHENKICFGKNLKEVKRLNRLTIKFLIDAYKDSDNKEMFFNNYFIKLVGVDNLRNQIVNGHNENEIRKSWKKDLEKFKLIRNKYLIYE